MLNHKRQTLIIYSIFKCLKEKQSHKKIFEKLDIT